jgi:hypothetical protein
MNQLGLGLSTLGLVGLLACGGRAIQEPGDDSEPSQPAPTSSAKGGGGSGPGKGNSTGSLPSKELGQCMPGFDRAQNPTLPCHWLTESGMCFDDSDAACACICPTNRNSVCSHGFDRGPDSRTLIFCD